MRLDDFIDDVQPEPEVPSIGAMRLSSKMPPIWSGGIGEPSFATDTVTIPDASPRATTLMGAFRDPCCTGWR
jgi:hypothetical protein